MKLGYVILILLVPILVCITGLFFGYEFSINDLILGVIVGLVIVVGGVAWILGKKEPYDHF